MYIRTHACGMQGADIVIMDVDGKTALHWTASNPDDATTKTLLVRFYDNDLLVL